MNGKKSCFFFRNVMRSSCSSFFKICSASAYSNGNCSLRMLPDPDPCVLPFWPGPAYSGHGSSAGCKPRAIRELLSGPFLDHGHADTHQTGCFQGNPPFSCASPAWICRAMKPASSSPRAVPVISFKISHPFLAASYSSPNKAAISC